MALNNRSFKRVATRFNRLFIKLSDFKQEGAAAYGDYQATQMVIIKTPPGQTANILEVHDYLANVLFAISPTGQVIGGVGSTPGLGHMGVAHATYNFATDGGASCTPALNAVIPANALIIGATVNPTTAPLAAGAATIGVGTTAGSSATSILAATAKATLSIDSLLNGVPTLAAPVKMSAAGSISLVIATGPLTAGVIEVFVYYTVAQNA